MLSCGLLIFILHQYLVIGRWPLLTSVVWRHKNLIHMTCKSAPDYLGVIQDTFLVEHILGFASTAARKSSLKGSGNLLPNGPEKSHPNLQPWPAVDVTAHFPELLPTLTFIICKISCQLAQ